MLTDLRTMLDVFGPTRVLVGSREDPVCCAAAAALLVSRCEQEHPQPWLACACATLSSIAPAEVMVSAMLADPAPEPICWKPSATAVGGRFSRKLMDAVLAELRAGLPSDDLADRLGHRAMWPQTVCAKREDLVAGEAWATSRYRASRRQLGLGEFVRVVAPLEDHLGRPRTFLLQFDGVGDGWKPDDSFVQVAGVSAACVWAAFKDRFIAPLERSEQTMALLSPIRRRIARLVVAGKTETQIGEMVGRSRHTVRDHVKGMYHMFEVSTRSELIARLSGVRRSGITPSLPESALIAEESPVRPDPELKPSQKRSRPLRRGAIRKNGDKRDASTPSEERPPPQPRNQRHG